MNYAKNISIEIKIIVGIIAFTLFIVSLERYQLSENITKQFIESKKSKNNLLLNTISPIISLNISLGLGSANKEYLDMIVKQNRDLESLKMIDLKGNIIYNYSKNNKEISSQHKNNMNFGSVNIRDSVTEEKLGSIHLYFSNYEYQIMKAKNTQTTLEVFMVTFVLLIIFIVFIKRELKYLKELSVSVLSYDPKINNFTLTPLDRKDEVGIIHNAIVSMVTKINSHSKLLDDINHSLEDKVKERTKELEKANQRLLELSITDPLTKISNRRHFEMSFANSWTLATRNAAAISVIMCDIDYFKNVNDTFGHAVGDSVLINVAKIMKNSLKRSSDLIARYGGEEFVIVLYNTDIHEAQKLCKKIQDALSKYDAFKDQENEHKPITVSFGVSSIVPTKEDNSENLLRVADTCLYEAKDRGRNCIVTCVQEK